MEEKTDISNPGSVLEFKDVVFEVEKSMSPLNLSLNGGQLAFVKARSVANYVLGLREIGKGEIRYLGKTWGERPVFEVEDHHRTIGTVVNSRSQSSASWVTNLDVKENVLLSASFDRHRSGSAIEKQAASLAKSFALDEGLPTLRAPKVDDGDLIRAQWVRAFLPDPLKLLILENPLFHAPGSSVSLFVDAVKRALDDGVAVLWAAEIQPLFANFALEPDFLLE